jgi:hypothetical protein
MDAITRYDIDDYWTWQSTFTRGGDGVDPTTLTVIVQDPDGVETTVVNAVSPIGLAPTSIPVARIDTGIFQGNPGVHLTAPGYWFVKVKGTGLAAAAETHVAYVEQDPIDVEAPVMYMQPGELADSIALTPGEIDDWQPDLVRALIAASRGVEQLTGQRFWPDPDATQVRYYTADRDIVRTDPIITLTSLDVDARGNGSYSTNLTAGTDFALEPRNAGADGIPYTRIRRLCANSSTFDRWQALDARPNADARHRKVRLAVRPRADRASDRHPRQPAAQAVPRSTVRRARRHRPRRCRAARAAARPRPRARLPARPVPAHPALRLMAKARLVLRSNFKAARKAGDDAIAELIRKGHRDDARDGRPAARRPGRAARLQPLLHRPQLPRHRRRRHDRIRAVLR